MLEDKNLKIEWKEIQGKKYLYFTFKGIFTKDDADSSIAKWKKLFDLNKDEGVTIIWQCLEMENYEADARVVWQKAIRDLSDKIDMIWLITDSVLIQAGAEIISFFVSYDIKIVKSEEELCEKIAKQKTNSV